MYVFDLYVLKNRSIEPGACAGGQQILNRRGVVELHVGDDRGDPMAADNWGVHIDEVHTEPSLVVHSA